jgi:hypothetical protein
MLAICDNVSAVEAGQYRDAIGLRQSYQSVDVEQSWDDHTDLLYTLGQQALPPATFYQRAPSLGQDLESAV